MANDNKLELVVEVDVNNANASIKSVNTVAPFILKTAVDPVARTGKWL